MLVANWEIRGPMAEKWEYTVVDTVIGAYRNTENQLAEWFPNLNALGDVGWEVVSAVVIHARGTNATQWPLLLLKRRRPPS